MLRVKRMGVWWEYEKEGEGLEQSLRGMEVLWSKGFRLLSPDN